MISLSNHLLPLLSASSLITGPTLPLPSLPERVLQFGTGVLLRGLPDYLIDKANRQGIFNGRIVLVKSTESGDIGAFHRQDNLYTLCIRGVENQQLVEEKRHLFGHQPRVVGLSAVGRGTAGSHQSGIAHCAF